MDTKEYVLQFLLDQNKTKCYIFTVQSRNRPSYFPAETLLHSLLPDGVDPAHLVLVGRRLDEVMRVRLRDDFKQVALDVAFHTWK